MSRLPGREALEAELVTAERPVRPPVGNSVLEPKVVPWDRRVPPDAPKPPPTLGERLRALFARR